MFKNIRILMLLCVLLFVSVSAYTIDSSLRDWSKTKWVVVYPINGDKSQASADYIERLQASDFDKMNAFLNQQASEFGVSASEAFKVMLGPTLEKKPPPAPQQGAWYDNIWWSLKLRLWASDATEHVESPPADVRIFVEYYDPKAYERLPHSVGMRKLSLAVVKAFASRKMTQSNNVVMVHELLHVFGATDKYDLASNQPIFPLGYAEPTRRPLFPQVSAEIMGGRIPVSEHRAIIPKGFSQVVVGQLTAAEIGWLDTQE